MDTGAGMLFELGKAISGVISVASYLHMLSDSKQLNSVAQTAVNCIDVAYKVGHFFTLFE